MNKGSLVLRSVLALILMLGFYCLALLMIGVLVYIPYAEWVYGHRIHIKLAFACIIGALVILTSIIPRRDKFIKPGPRLSKQDHPALFCEIKNIAKATGQEMPKEIYLIPEVNAWVSNRGGVMGIGSRRMMGLGLPLLKVLTVSQFRAVLAHEFGHYYGGDTKLAPWIYKTYTAIIRTLQGLGEHSSILQKPFLWYGKLYLRITHAVSRAQEYTADRLAASFAGTENMEKGLYAVYSTGILFDAYWENEVVPVLNSGFQPPITQGFGLYLNSDTIENAAKKILQNEMDNSDNDPYSTHPSLSDRVAALRKLNCGNDFDKNNELAVSLIENIGDLEKDLLLSITDNNKLSKLTSIDWDQTGEKVYARYWESAIGQQTAALKDITPLDIPKIANQPDEFVKLLKNDTFDENMSVLLRAGNILGAAIAFLLYLKGWAISALPGEDVVISKADYIIKPFSLLEDLSKNEICAEEWINKCMELGLEKVNLGRVAVGGFQREEQLSLAK